MQRPNALIYTPFIGWRNTAPETIRDFTGYLPVTVSPYGDPAQIGAEANHCIDNAVALAEYGDLSIVQGYITIRCEDPLLGLFHYWNRCDCTGLYWDSTPFIFDRSQITYWLLDPNAKSA